MSERKSVMKFPNRFLLGSIIISLSKQNIVSLPNLTMPTTISLNIVVNK